MIYNSRILTTRHVVAALPEGRASDAVMDFTDWAIEILPPVDPGDDTVTEYVVDWGDGITNTLTAQELADAGGQISHAYADSGDQVKTISIDLLEEDGTTHENAASIDITVNDVEINGTGGSPTAGITITANGTADFDFSIIDTMIGQSGPRPITGIAVTNNSTGILSGTLTGNTVYGVLRDDFNIEYVLGFRLDKPSG